MARLKIFTKLSDNSWDVIQNVHSRRFKGHKETNECNIVNITREYPEKIFRTYCKCGYTSGKLEGTCPECGNDKLKSFTLNGTRRIDIEEDKTFEEEYMSNSKGIIEECISGYSQERYVEILPTNEFEFFETKPRKEFSICSDKIDSSITRYNSYSYEEFMKVYKYSLENFEFYQTSNSSKYMDDVINFIQLKEDFSVLMSNLNKYPNIVNHIVSKTSGTEPFKKIKDWDEVYPLLGVPKKELNSYIENLYRGSTRYYSYYYSGSVVTNAFENYNLLSPKLQLVAEYMLIHGNICYDDFNGACNTMKSIPDEEADVLLYFVRNNYVSSGPKVINDYVRKTDFIKSEGYEVSIPNMDTRNYNLIKNKKYITENQRYNEKRTMFFLEMFDLNPLDSLQYLNTRRAPNKDLRKELADKLD